MTKKAIIEVKKMEGEEISIGHDILLGEIAKLKVAGYRFVTMSCVELNADMLEILYHFDKNFNLKHLRMTVHKGADIPSISPLYFSAFLVENEIQDHFGLRFEGLVIDYDRTLYLGEGADPAPFCKYRPNRLD